MEVVLRIVVGVVLVALSVAAFVLVGLAVWGVPGLASAWPALTIAAATVSLAMLIAFWDRQLVLGVAIDLAVLVLAVWRPGWTDRIA